MIDSMRLDEYMLRIVVDELIKPDHPWRDELREYLPERLVDKIVAVFREKDCTAVIYFGYKVVELHEPWLSDQFLARIALEAPT